MTQVYAASLPLKSLLAAPYTTGGCRSAGKGQVAACASRIRHGLLSPGIPCPPIPIRKDGAESLARIAPPVSLAPS